MLKVVALIVAAVITISTAVWVSTVAFEEKVVATVTTRGPPSSTLPPVTITVTTPEVTVTVPEVTLPTVTLPSITLP